MTRPQPTITARWPSGRNVLPGRDAQAFLKDEAERLGFDPAAIIRSVEKNDPSGLMVLALLGLAREAVCPSNRPKDVPRALLIVRVVDDLVDEGRTKAEAFSLAGRYLAEPSLRARRQMAIEFGDDVVLGKGRVPKPMTPSAVRSAYRLAKELIPELWFQLPDEQHHIP
ncbi:hypothetical protein [Methylobacterium terrae]|uniref:hypothetical protein n=1 Tax=Methylobacterium terrae TaxID=2202827 RepID=UPI0013A56E0B|nr:hypothetical protein [Methylobacterium terrae]